jgi:prophage antirepressor-like protein
MSDEIIRYKTTFGGRGLTFYRFEERPVVLASSFGQVLGYANDGKKLADRIRDDWREDFIAGRDFYVLTGEKLRAFKRLLGDTPEPGVSATARLMVLYVPGIDLVCLRTEKPEGRALRRFLVDEVLPQLRSGELAALPSRRKRPRLSPERAALKRLVDQALLAGRPDLAHRILTAVLELEPRALEAAPVVAPPLLVEETPPAGALEG